MIFMLVEHETNRILISYSSGHILEDASCYQYLPDTMSSLERVVYSFYCYPLL